MVSALQEEEIGFLDITCLISVYQWPKDILIFFEQKKALKLQQRKVVVHLDIECIGSCTIFTNFV
jgi:hypothetical protein